MKPDNWLPPDYEPPQTTGKYMKLAVGDNIFRALDKPIFGFVAWKDKKVQRRRENTFKPADLDAGTKAKHFWAFPVWNYAANCVQVLELTQSTVQEAIKNLSRNAKWGSPLAYDVVVTAKGEKMDREYQVVPEPKSDLPEAAYAAWSEAQLAGFDISRLFDGGDPFGEAGDAVEREAAEYRATVGPDADIPF